LIIGGGDGGVLREVLRYDSVEKATIIEIDSEVVSTCQEYLPFISNGAFDDRRTNLIIGDGADYIQKTDARYDVIIVDSPDPIGPAQALFSEQFYQEIYNALRSTGIIVRQTGSLHMQSEEQGQAYRLLNDIFRWTSFYLYSVPTYVGGLFSTLFCSETIDPSAIDIKTMTERFNLNKLMTRYYTPGVHIASFNIPPFFKENYL
jgi:spermidine synthase